MDPRQAGDDDGDSDDGGDGDGGRIFPGHPGPIPNAPRDNISRKGIPSLRYREYIEGLTPDIWKTSPRHMENEPLTYRK